MSAFDHYKQHLSQFYTWMFGEYGSMVARQKSLLQEHCHITSPTTSQAVAIDLGSGPGFQSIAMKELGFNVHAVDFSEELLNELKVKDSSISLHCGDLRDLKFVEDLSLKPELIVCMGDTLTHLDTKDSIVELFQKCFELLKDQHGTLVLSYRDLSQIKTNTDRFIPVRSDDKRILTCFLEDHDEDSVHVYDLLHQKDEQGLWNLHKSFYRKLKLPVEWITDILRTTGYEVTTTKLPSGLEVVVARVA